MNNRNKKKKSPIGLIIVIIMLGSSFVSSDAFFDFTRRLRRAFRTGSFRFDGGETGAVAAAAVGVVLLITLFVAIRRIKRIRVAKRFDGIKARGGGTAAAHSHDQLQGYRGNESAEEHWKKQLDGFLAAGIIDRSEYRVLQERRRR